MTGIMLRYIHTVSFITALTLAAFVGSACAERARPSDSWSGSIDTLTGGVLHVRNPEQAIWSAEQSWSAVEELRIGAAASEGPDMFGEVAAIGVAPNGQIHVIDAHAQEIRVFSQTGEHVRSFGRRGAGPGEFSNAYALEWDHAGRLWITDPGNARYAVYDTVGSLLFHVPRTVPGVLFPWLGGFARSGALYDVSASQGPDGVSRFTYYRVTEAGGIDTAGPPVEHHPTGPPPASMLLFWLTPRTTFAFQSSGYLWVANTGEYRIIQRSLTGDTVRIVTRVYSSTPVSQAERDSIAKELRAAPPGEGDAAIPSTRPAIERLFTDPESYLYVKRVGDRADTRSSFDVFDPGGRFLGEMHSNVAFTMFPALPRFYSDAIYGVTTDFLGVQYVVKARIDRPR
jgi:hypothetical protein